MKVNQVRKEPFTVIGKEGSTSDGEDFIQKLWEDANAHFEEVGHLAKKDENGNLCGIWGAMSDFSRSFNPWEDFDKGLYLAGVECNDDAKAPDGWTYGKVQNIGGNKQEISFCRDNIRCGKIRNSVTSVKRNKL